MPFDPKIADAAARQLILQQRSRPVHIHTCPGDQDGNGEHMWTCPSAYCEDVSARPLRCPAHGGEFPHGTRPEDFGA